MRKHVVVFLDIAAFSAGQFEKWRDSLPTLSEIAERGTYRPLKPTFPALTCSQQATFFAGKPPADHGIVGNGWFDRDLMSVAMWPQEASRARGPMLWDIYRERDPKSIVALLFLMQSRYANAEIVVGPAPLHTEDGTIEWCYSKPPGLYERLAEKLGAFKLASFWGPLAGWESSEWIANAALWLLENETPDCAVVYLPQMDYVCQRKGPYSDEARNDAAKLDSIIKRFYDWCCDWGNAVLIVASEYGMTEVNRVVYPNRLLCEAGLVKLREIGGGLYIDFEHSDAFAVCDHQVAHIYCRGDAAERVREIMSGVDGVAAVWGEEQKKAAQVAHPRCGDLILVAEPNTWFAYYYWDEGEERLPFFAHKVDIHNKPGYDPCALFFDPQIKGIPLAPHLIKGSHGIVGDGAEDAVFFCSDGVGDYAPQKLASTQILAMLYRVM